MVKQGQLPQLDQQDSPTQWKGHDLDDVILTSQKVSLSAATQGQMLNFYISVFPFMEPQAYNETHQSYTFTIAFYDDAEYVRLQDGYPIRGVVTNQSIDYYFFDIPDVTQDYEITLS
jgi:hypothetical protein